MPAGGYRLPASFRRRACSSWQLYTWQCVLSAAEWEQPLCLMIQKAGGGNVSIVNHGEILKAAVHLQRSCLSSASSADDLNGVLSI